MGTQPRSLWLDQALAREDGATLPTLDNEIRADICIVGGGFTGLWTAIFLKQREPNLSVVIIEKDICGGGASGRNGGFCMTWMAKASTVLKLCGGQDGVALLKKSEENVTAIARFCEEHGIDCQFRQDGWFWVASNAAQSGSWSETVNDLARVGLTPYRQLSRNQLGDMTGTDRLHSGIYDSAVATVQPAMLARGLRKVALGFGVKIYENTPMTGLDRNSPPRVTTARGAVRADTVVLALNAWAHELPEFRRTLLPVPADVIATVPIPDKLSAIGMDRCVAISDSRLLINFYRRTVDGRMVWGYGGGVPPFAGRVGTNYDGVAPRVGEAEAMMHRYYPSLADVKLAAHWQGPEPRSASGLPFFGAIRGSDRVLYGHGYTGNGVGPSRMGGQILADMALRQKTEWTDIALTRGPVESRLPPEPIRYIGSKFVRAASIRVDRAEDAGRKPSKLDLKLASFARRVPPAGKSSLPRQG